MCVGVIVESMEGQRATQTPFHMCAPPLLIPPLLLGKGAATARQLGSHWVEPLVR